MSPTQRPSRAKRIAAAIAGVFVVIAAGLVAGPGSRWSLERKIEKSRATMREIVVATLGLFVDDCSETLPDEGNLTPTKLTTPVGYLKSLPRDPFSRKGEPYHYLSQQGMANGSTVVIVSAGPDGVCEIENLPIKVEVPKPFFADEKTTGVLLRGGIGADRGPFRYLIQSAELVYRENKIVPVPLMTVTYLPKVLPWARDHAMGHADAVRYLTENGVPVYDPTNGSVSRGDVIYTSSWDETKQLK
ncbi:MAG: hypothetical protein K1X53_15195 [Candidatus Sumerlaeaceae bacterium]|nr:hypothetical protein [Candidatus Sumerlaeaceae bacterium]